MLILLIVGVLLLIVGYRLGKIVGITEQLDKQIDKDLAGVPRDQIPFMTFTETERHELGRAIVLGDKKAAEEARRNLDHAIIAVRSRAADAHAKRLGVLGEGK